MQSVHLRASILGVCLVLYAQKVCQAQTQPNVVLILSDDLAWTDYSCMGHADHGVMAGQDRSGGIL